MQERLSFPSAVHRYTTIRVGKGFTNLCEKKSKKKKKKKERKQSKKKKIERKKKSKKKKLIFNYTK